MGGDYVLPTRPSTKETLRSHWRTNAGGHAARPCVPTLVLLGCCRCSGATATAFSCFGQYVAADVPCSCVVEQYVSEDSESEGNAQVSSDDWEDASDQTEAEEEAEEPMDEEYGPFRYEET